MAAAVVSAWATTRPLQRGSFASPPSSSSPSSASLRAAAAPFSRGPLRLHSLESSRSGNRRSSAPKASPPRAKYIREDYLVKKVSAKEVAELVKGERSVPTVVDFYATWCGPCIIMAQQLETLAVEYENNVQFVKVDTDDEYEFARDMQVRGLPTLYFISPDPTKDAIRTEGLVPPEMIKSIIENDL
ncbi:thioredoxin z [Wolffia australiana]